MKEVFLLLGSNRGDRDGFLVRAGTMIAAEAGRIVASSAIYETSPWGFQDETPFLNQVLQVSTGLGPEDLLQVLLGIEARLGRIRPFEGCGCSVSVEYAGRTIDIDILFYGSRLVFTDSLMIPHPRLHERRFTLVPLAEIAPGFVHPLLKRTVASLLQECTDKGEVARYNPGFNLN